jgi:peptidoglycan/xylan/chitin deacetylase (PgdA/CDA1 family)
MFCHSRISFTMGMVQIIFGRNPFERDIVGKDVEILVETLASLGYLGQLRSKWGLSAPRQLYRMFQLHRTSFSTILQNLYSVLEETNGRFAFPTVAGIARMRPELVREIIKEGHEVASHGFNHVRYNTISEQARRHDLFSSLNIFKEIGIEITGFRAPYDRYTNDMPALLEQTNIVWDGGWGFQADHREKTHFFHEDIDSQTSRVTYIPLNIWSDDYMIDRKGMGPDLVTRVLKRELTNVAPTGGVIMFDLHPIRMGQERFVGCLKDLIEHAQELGAWCTTPTEAVTYWNIHKKWKSDSKFCLLLTGDIDNWVFADYMRRILWRRRTG